MNNLIDISKIDGKGNDIGDIDEFIVSSSFDIKSPIESDYNNTIKLKFHPDEDSVEFRVVKYSNHIPIILDSIKTFFRIFETKYNVAYINNTRVLIYETRNEIPLKIYMKNRTKFSPVFIYSLRKMFAFQWIMCMNTINDDKIFVRPLHSNVTKVVNSDRVVPVSIGELTYKIDSAVLPSKIIKTYFDNDIELFYEIAYDIIKEYDPVDIKFKMSKIIKKYESESLYNKTLMFWVNSVYERVNIVINCNN